MINLSTALRAAMATEYGLMAMMQYGCIKVFDGDPPLTADMAEQGQLLATITQDGVPFQWGTMQGALNMEPGPTNGACQKLGAWKVTVTTSGQAGWWRFVWNGYDGGEANEWVPRVDGRIGEGLILPDSTLISGDVLDVESFFFIIQPTSN